jgi:hypothetical protein
MRPAKQGDTVRVQHCQLCPAGTLIQRDPSKLKGPSKNRSDKLVETFWHMSCASKGETVQGGR